MYNDIGIGIKTTDVHYRVPMLSILLSVLTELAVGLLGTALFSKASWSDVIALMKRSCRASPASQVKPTPINCDTQLSMCYDSPYAYHIWTDPTFSYRTLNITMTSLWHHLHLWHHYDLIYSTMTSLTPLWHHSQNTINTLQHRCSNLTCSYLVHW